MKKSFLRILALSLSLLMLFHLLVSCKGRPLGQTRLAKTDVGKVGKYTVQYEELYFLAHNYCEAVKDNYKNDPEGLKKAVWKYVEENIIANYAILSLCETEGLSYDEKALKDQVEQYIELTVESSFDGNRGEYIESQEYMGLTDHYVRFVLGVDLLYDQLEAKYRENGTVPNTDEGLLAYIKENFVHTWHIAILVDGEDDREEELKKAEEALALLNSGTSMYHLIGSKYNEDTTIDSLTDTYGNYFSKGVMTKEFEDAAFALKVNEVSEIIESTAKNSKGEYVECFYILQRLALSDDEIKANFETLTDSVSASIVADKMEAVKATLSFEKNEYAASLDITALKFPGNGADTQAILIVALCVLGVAAIVTAIVVIRKVRTKRFHRSIKK